MKFPGIRTGTVKFELMNNPVNIDKYPEMFMGQTNEELSHDVASCRNILK